MKRSSSSSSSTRSSSSKVPASGIVETTHVEGITYQRKYIRCGKDRCRKGCARGVPSHGPYWYAITWKPSGGTRAYYVGKELPRLDQLAERPEKGNPK